VLVVVARVMEAGVMLQAEMEGKTSSTRRGRQASKWTFSDGDDI
jgi:hypothetical protein